jgi:hypothetical protein
MDTPAASAAVVVRVAAILVEDGDVYPTHEVLPAGLPEVSGAGVELLTVLGYGAEGGLGQGDSGLAEVAGEMSGFFDFWGKLGYWHNGSLIIFVCGRIRSPECKDQMYRVICEGFEPPIAGSELIGSFNHIKLPM